MVYHVVSEHIHIIIGIILYARSHTNIYVYMHTSYIRSSLRLIPNYCIDHTVPAAASTHHCNGDVLLIKSTTTLFTDMIKYIIILWM